MTTTRLQKLSTNALIALAIRAQQNCDAAMRRYAAGTDALKYGWDWPTLKVLFPRLGAFWSKIVAEGKARGLNRVTIPAIRDPFKMDGYRSRRRARFHVAAAA